MKRDGMFRIAVRKFTAFETAIAKQWEAFDLEAQTGLRLEAVPLDLHALHRALFESGGAASGEWDIVFLNTDWVGEAGYSKAFWNLAPYVAADPPEDYPQGWSPSLLRLQQVGSSILGLPYHDGPECLIYRKDLFEDAGECAAYQQATGRPLSPPGTWEEFHELAHFFSRPNQNLYGSVFAGFPDGHNTVYDFCLQLWSRGGELFDSGGNPRLNSSAAKAALHFYRSIRRDAKAIHPGSAYFDSVQAGLAFAAGEVALMVNWFGFAALCETLADSKVRGKVAVTNLPSNGGPHVSLNVYWILAIAGGTPFPEIAWKFLRHCASPAMDKLLTLEGGIGCRKSTWDDDDVNRTIPFYRAMSQLHKHARELPGLAQWTRIAEVIDGLVLTAVNSNCDDGALLDEAQGRIVKMLRPEDGQFE